MSIAQLVVFSKLQHHPPLVVLPKHMPEFMELFALKLGECQSLKSLTTSGHVIRLSARTKLDSSRIPLGGLWLVD